MSAEASWLRRAQVVSTHTKLAWCLPGQHLGLVLGDTPGPCPVCTPFYDSIKAPEWAKCLIWVNE